MAFNKQDFLSLITDTLGTIAINDNSVLSDAESKLKTFLETNTSISDNEKAQVYSKFLTDVVTNSINSALQSATNIMLQQAKIEQEIASMQIEDQIKQEQSAKDLEVKAQQIASMKAQDEINKNKVAGELAKIKYEVEHLMPAQVDNIIKDTQIKDKELELKQEDIELKKKQVELANKEVTVKEAEIQIKKAEVDISRSELQIKQAQIPLVQAQAETEKAKAFLVGQQGITEQYNQDLVKANKDQILENINKLKKEEDLLDYQKDLTNAERNLKDQQAVAVLRALDVNKEIEMCKCRTQLEIASLQVQSL